jgi:DNA mismatch endonuclease (patch repair protein)
VADIVEKAKRSEMMSRIQGKDTIPEITIRRELHRRGFRFRLHDRRLPGKPDIVLPKYQAAIQVNGCFWHGHDCHLMKWPSTRPEFWRKKILGNADRDAKNIAACADLGWRVLVVWECALKGKRRKEPDAAINEIVSWLLSKRQQGEICGK